MSTTKKTNMIALTIHEAIPEIPFEHVERIIDMVSAAIASHEQTLITLVDNGQLIIDRAVVMS